VTIHDAAPEPDWAQVFDAHLAFISPRSGLAHYALCDEAYELTLLDWRRRHGRETWGCKRCRIAFEREREACPRCRGPAQAVTKSAPALEGVLALARLRIMPPKSLEPDPQDPDKCRGEDDHALYHPQHDAQCWLTVQGEAWAIQAIEDNMLCLWRGWAPELEYRQVDLAKVNWEKYIEHAVQLLEAGG
jgi:hypothetical protein